MGSHKCDDYTVIPTSTQHSRGPLHPAHPGVPRSPKEDCVVATADDPYSVKGSTQTTYEAAKSHRANVGSCLRIAHTTSSYRSIKKESVYFPWERHVCVTLSGLHACRQQEDLPPASSP
eukprot:1161301-Pelagomonas_calceolata.AAC.8